MEVFVQIDTGDQWPRDDSARPRFEGVLFAGKAQAVVDCVLLPARTAVGGGAPIAKLQNYSRRSEPWLALLARLIERSEPGFLAQPIGALPVTVTLSVSGEHDRTEVVEVLATQRGLDGFGAAMVSLIRHEVLRIPLPRPEITLRDFLLETCWRFFGWHPHSGPVPTALTQVPIRQHSGDSMVAMVDIPPYPRALFALRYHLDDWQMTAPAHLWFEFITAADHEIRAPGEPCEPTSSDSA